LLYVEDIRLVRQNCTTISVAFDDTAVAEFFDEQVDAGRLPEQFARVWIHTHPGESAQPSHVDEETFGRVFGACDWAVMFILARGGETYCRLGFSAGPGGGFEIPVEVDFERAFKASEFAAWSQEYAAAVRQWKCGTSDVHGRGPLADDSLSISAHEFFDDFWESFEQRKEPLLDERPL
jgi:proteasome lid subunit RPN8/RPN11